MSLHRVRTVVDRCHYTPGEKRDALLFDDATPLLDDAWIHAGEDLREDLDDGDARSERGEQAPELAANDAAATDPVCTLSPNRPKVDAILANLNVLPGIVGAQHAAPQPGNQISVPADALRSDWLYRPNPA